MPQTIKLTEWVNASIDQRQEWLRDGTAIDETGLQVLHWALLFKNAGASISDEQMLAVYEEVLPC